jgi:hypothetical protein
MTSLAQTMSTTPGVILVAALAVGMAGPVGLVVVLRDRGWTPLRDVRSRLSRRR